MQEQFIPIDIHTNKLSDWLISRRHCNKEWNTYIFTIREKINNAIQDMPVHAGIAKLLSGSYINYFHCLKIIEILKETEADSKNFFGSYGSKRMKDWQEIVRLYEKDNVYLSEAAQMLIRNVNYEVPGLKKQITKCEQLQVECGKKAEEYEKTHSTLMKEFQASCKQLGIKGVKIKHELVNLLVELPDIYVKVANNVKSLGQAVEFYKEFSKLVFGTEHPGGSVPLLMYMIEHGNTTTYEWVYGEPPLKIEEPASNLELEDENNTTADDNAIDFGDVDGIGFGDNAIEEGEIDWGISSVDSLDPQIQEVDSNITLEESGIVVESSGTEEGIAKGKDALTLLDNPATRNTFIDELMELECFLKVRLHEMNEANNLLALSQLQYAPAILQLQTTQTVSQMLNQVQKVNCEITNPRTQHLHNIKNSPRYIDNLADSLRHTLETADKMVATQKVVRQTRKDAEEEVRSLEPKLKLIILKTKELQGQIEQDISKRYKNRPVNIMGGINML